MYRRLFLPYPMMYILLFNYRVDVVRLGSFGGEDFLEPPLVNAGIFRKLGMEARAQNIALSDGDDVSRAVLGLSLRYANLGLVDSSGQRGQHRHTICSEHLFDNRRTNEDTGELGVGAEERQVERLDKGLDLAAKVVAVDTDAEASDELLAALLRGVGFVGQKDQAGAGTPYGLLLDPTRKRSRLARVSLKSEMQRTHLTKSRRGSRRPDCAATKEMVVLSPPGMMRASHEFSCSRVRTSMAVISRESLASERAALRTRVTCSAKPPCRARTPTTMLVCCIWSERFASTRKMQIIIRIRGQRLAGKEERIVAMSDDTRLLRAPIRFSA